MTWLYAIVMSLALGVVLSACAVEDETMEIVLSPQEIVAAAGGIYKVGEPYDILGQRFTPRVDPTYDTTGIASWYAEEFHGNRTANGEHYDMYLFSAAHPILPMPSWVEVTNLSNQKKVILRVNDRGPFKKGREIDLSLAAAQRIDLFNAGQARVRVRYLGRAPLYSPRGRLLDAGDAIPANILAAYAPSAARQDTSMINRARRSLAPVQAASPYAMVQNGGWILQIGTYKRRASAQQLARQYDELSQWQVSKATRGSTIIYRVHSPLLSSAAAAEDLRTRLARAGHTDSLILRPR